MQMYGNKFKRTKQSFVFLKRNLQLVILSMVYIKNRVYQNHMLTV